MGCWLLWDAAARWSFCGRGPAELRAWMEECRGAGGLAAAIEACASERSCLLRLLLAVVLQVLLQGAGLILLLMVRLLLLL